jgi:hypothetical protein
MHNSAKFTTYFKPIADGEGAGGGRQLHQVFDSIKIIFYLGRLFEND